MTIQDLDDISEIPSFGKAMQSVGWVIEEEDGSLLFPNFCENNTPSKTRGTVAKSDAERARAYRARKKAEREKEQEGKAVTSRHAREEKRREENIKPPLSPLGEWDEVFPSKSLSKSRTEQKRIKVLRNNEKMAYIGKWYGRKPETLWTVAEAKALKEINPPRDEVETLKSFLASDYEFHRQDILTLLNNWSTELDKAHSYLAKQSKPKKPQFSL